MLKWDERFLDKAKLIATWSKDETGVGAVIYDTNNTPVSEGRNGLPRGVSDDMEIYDGAIRVVIHAEVNAILFADRARLKGSTIYVSMPTCANCAALIIQCGIKRVVSVHTTMLNNKWRESYRIAQKMYEEAGVEVVAYVDLEKSQ